jgi:uncharacterized Zn finger protein
MPAVAPVTEDLIQRLTPDTATLQAAREVYRRSQVLQPGVSPDGTWLLGQCQGSAREPYEVSVDLANAEAPVCRCTCPSRKRPCKHVLALLLTYVFAPEVFAERTPPDELLVKRKKSLQQLEKAAADKAPRKVNTAAQRKKAAAQRQGLDLLEKLLLDLVAGGQWYEESRLERLRRLARQMNDHYLPGAAILLQRLLYGVEWSGEAREEHAAAVFAALWATVQRGRNYLDGKLAGEETPDEADAVLEELLGHAWQLRELKEKGYVRQALYLLELAHQRVEEPARQELVESSYLLDLNAGTLYRAVTYRPLNRLQYVAEQPSYQQVLRLSEAVVYPGFLCRRLRWEKSAEQTEPVTAAHLQAAYQWAQPTFAPALAAYRKQLKNPLAKEIPAVFLLRCARIGRVGDAVVLEDQEGTRLVAQDYREGDGNVANLVRAAGMLRQPAVLVWPIECSAPTRLRVQPLAALTPEVHLRLGV